MFLYQISNVIQNKIAWQMVNKEEIYENLTITNVKYTFMESMLVFFLSFYCSSFIQQYTDQRLYWESFMILIRKYTEQVS